MKTIARPYVVWICALCAAFWASLSLAGSITLGWDPNPPHELVTGYIVYMGPISKEDPLFTGYAVEVDVGDVTEGEMEVPAEYGETGAFFAAIAYNAAGMKSDYSNEVTLPAITPPVIRFSFFEGIFRVEPLRCGDCDFDGDVDGIDLALFRKEFGR